MRYSPSRLPAWLASSCAAGAHKACTSFRGRRKVRPDQVRARAIPPADDLTFIRQARYSTPHACQTRPSPSVRGSLTPALVQSSQGPDDLQVDPRCQLLWMAGSIQSQHAGIQFRWRGSLCPHLQRQHDDVSAELLFQLLRDESDRHAVYELDRRGCHAYFTRLHEHRPRGCNE